MIDTLKLIIGRREIRFLFVGALNTLVGYGTYALLIYLGVLYLVANTVATILGIAHSYIWNRYFTFQSRRKVRRELVRFILVYATSYTLSMFLLYALVDKLGLNTYLAGMLNIMMITIISWFGHKHFSFKEDQV